ncbi:hypothetical protein B566_EDAN008981 [Ephemera danica]|nr:hypothetical protein B566_EDAN008981 [Ephemera danica]
MLSNEQILTVLACAVIFYVLTRKWFFNLRQRFFVVIMTSIGRSTDIALRAMNLKPAHTAPLANICSKMQGITLEKFYATDAADMHEIPDGSVDAVLTQFSLCSCSDGGKYYFSEHVIDKYSFWRRLLQWFIHYSGPRLDVNFDAL